jgi:hypothetical protein
MNTIPNIIIGLLMVTFSFAIVGLLLDLGRLLTLLLGSYFASALNSGSFQVTGLSGPVEMARYAFIAVHPQHIGMLPALGSALFSGAGSIAWWFKVVTIGPGDTVLTSGLIGIIFCLVVGAIALYAGIRVFLTLLMAYMKIVIELILGPIYLLMASLPGKQTSMMDWIKRIIQNILVFPMVFVIINLARYIGMNADNLKTYTPISFLNGGPTIPLGFGLGGAIVIAGYFIAANVPPLIADFIPVEGGKGMQASMQGTQDALKRIPLIGGLFG